jgi:hypothetical protein
MRRFTLPNAPTHKRTGVRFRSATLKLRLFAVLLLVPLAAHAQGSPFDTGYRNKELHTWLGHWIYADTSLSALFSVPLYWGLMALVLQLPFSLRTDIRRRKELRYGRRLKGPILVTARQFTKAVAGDGIGITTNDDKRPLRIPPNAENKHFLLVGDTGSGKSSIIRQMLYQVAARGESAIVYDPACEFVKQFYNNKRGDMVLNPLDARMPIGTHQKNFGARRKRRPWLFPFISRKG